LRIIASSKLPKVFKYLCSNFIQHCRNHTIFNMKSIIDFVDLFRFTREHKKTNTFYIVLYTRSLWSIFSVFFQPDYTSIHTRASIFYGVLFFDGHLQTRRPLLKTIVVRPKKKQYALIYKKN